MATLYIPPAVNMLIPRGTIGGAGQQPIIQPWMVILHTNASNTSLAGAASLMANTTKGQEYHCQQEAPGVGRIAGRLGQYVDFRIRADNNYRANSFYKGSTLCGAISIETADHGSPYELSWTDLGQRPALEDLLVWLCKTLGIPAVRCPDPYGRGIGYHSMWGYNTPSNMDINPWTNAVGKICPGPGKIREFPDLLAAVARRVAGTNPVGESDMPSVLLRAGDGSAAQQQPTFAWNGVNIAFVGTTEQVAVGKMVGLWVTDDAGNVPTLRNFSAAEIQALLTAQWCGPPGFTLTHYGYTLPTDPAVPAIAAATKPLATTVHLQAVQDQVNKIPTTGGGTGGGEAAPEYEITATLTGKATKPAPPA